MLGSLAATGGSIGGRREVRREWSWRGGAEARALLTALLAWIARRRENGGFGDARGGERRGEGKRRGCGKR
jgi:hypothetical protein